MMLLISFCVALCELSSVLLFIIVYEKLWPSSDRFPDCPCERTSYSPKKLTSVSDISDASRGVA